jgi:phage gp29-like protein
MAGKRPNKILDKIIASSTARSRKDIKQWRSALQQAEKPEQPKRTLLYNLYDELVLDARLSAEFDKRKLAVQGSEFSIYNPQDGIADNEKTKLLQKPWFFEFLGHAMDSKLLGHSLIQIGDLDENGEISEIMLVNRKHVVPETGMFTVRQGDEKGIYYRENKQYSTWLLEVGEKKDLGLLNKAAPHILYKRFAQSAWSEFCEIFGMPLRYGKTNVKDEESLNRMENMMINMGVASYAVVDNEEELNFVESAKSNGEVYSNLINLCNQEVSFIINGAVIGDSSSGGSRSKEEVGERTGVKVTKSDKQWIEGYLNTVLIPRLITLGYPFQGYEFRFEEAVDVNQLWTITQGLLPHYYIEEEYITNTFGIPVAKKETQDTSQNLKAGKGFF